MPTWLDNVLTLVCLAACVVAVFLARRGARKKWQAAYAAGGRAAATGGHAGAHVVVGDVTYVRGGGIATNYRAADRDDDDNDDVAAALDAARVPLYVTHQRHGVGELRDGASDSAREWGAVDARIARGRARGALRAARPPARALKR